MVSEYGWINDMLDDLMDATALAGRIGADATPVEIGIAAQKLRFWSEELLVAAGSAEARAIARTTPMVDADITRRPVAAGN